MKRYAIHCCAIALVAIAQCAGALTAESPPGTVEIGTFGDAAYRIDMPAKWNRTLIVFYHGYSQQMVRYDTAPANGFVQELMKRGHAVVQSGYFEIRMGGGAGGARNRAGAAAFHCEVWAAA